MSAKQSSDEEDCLTPFGRLTDSLLRRLVERGVRAYGMLSAPDPAASSDERRALLGGLWVAGR